MVKKAKKILRKTRTRRTTNSRIDAFQEMVFQQFKMHQSSFEQVIRQNAEAIKQNADLKEKIAGLQEHFDALIRLTVDNQNTTLRELRQQIGTSLHNWQHELTKLNEKITEFDRLSSVERESLKAAFTPVAQAVVAVNGQFNELQGQFEALRSMIWKR